MECASSAEWASLLVGDQEVNQYSYSYTSAGQNSSSTTTRQKGIRRGMLPGEILDFLPCNIENGLTGLFFIPTVGTFPDRMEGEQLFLHDLVKPTDDPSYIARSVAHQYLRPWSAEKAASFGVAEEMKPVPKATKKKKKPVEAQDLLEDLFS